MMRAKSFPFRLSATVAMGALLGNAISGPVLAQPAPPGDARPPMALPPLAPEPGRGDPPSRVGRIASETGGVSFRTSADTQWSAAQRNYPVTAGDVLWTEPGAQAELEFSASRVALSEQSEFELTSLDDSGLIAVTSMGEAYFHVIGLAANELWSVQTPRAVVRLAEAGRYDIVAGTTEQPTLITVLDGAAEIEGPGLALHIDTGQTATITGTNTFEGSIGPALRDAFVAGRLNAEQKTRAASSVPTQLTYVAGVEDLADYGDWSDVSDYGPVWYPRVSSDWAPYRDGTWAYVAPWGWTWVDQAAWGFVPFHYGRWAQIGQRWGWVPGRAPAAGRPVYAPALVSFVGLAAGLGAVAWVPLGPGEAYHPWYRGSRDYLGRINAGHPGDPSSVAGFVNRDAATSVPAGIMTESRPVRTFARPVPAPALGSAQIVVGQPPLRPTVATLGVTPAVARQLNLVPSGITGFPRPPAPGPAVILHDSGRMDGPPPRPGDPTGPRPERTSLPGVPPVPLAPPTARPAGIEEPRVFRPEERRPEERRPEERRPEFPPGPDIRRPLPPQVLVPEPLRPPPPPRMEQFRPPPQRIEVPRMEGPRPPPPRPEPAREEKKPGER
jgi:hypothetical protein